PRRPSGAAGQSARAAQGQTRRAAQYPGERSIPGLLPLDICRRSRRRDRGLPLKECRMGRLKPVTPGELLLEEFLVPMGLTKYRVAKEIGVPAQRIGEIVAGRRAITADTDL